mmetsp:Transcript_55579/g.148890  ORF Transcript_55579/g.148890 Transcript_55579/m.148890 type:complete len:206 (-) Transcript_55579:20-637(-)
MLFAFFVRVVVRVLEIRGLSVRDARELQHDPLRRVRELFERDLEAVAEGLPEVLDVAVHGVGQQPLRELLEDLLGRVLVIEQVHLLHADHPIAGPVEAPHDMVRQLLKLRLSVVLWLPRRSLLAAHEVQHSPITLFLLFVLILRIRIRPLLREELLQFHPDFRIEPAALAVDRAVGAQGGVGPDRLVLLQTVRIADCGRRGCGGG